MSDQEKGGACPLRSALYKTDEINQGADIVKCLPREDLLHLGCRPDPLSL